MTNDYAAFRSELDRVLRQRDPQALRAFLVERGQWQPDATMDPEAAQWMMIAASPNLGDLHDEAGAWLQAHGRASEADAILNRSSGTGRPATHGGRPPRKQTTPRKP